MVYTYKTTLIKKELAASNSRSCARRSTITICAQRKHKTAQVTLVHVLTVRFTYIHLTVHIQLVTWRLQCVRQVQRHKERSVERQERTSISSSNKQLRLPG
jgi:hypothetical protein